RGATAPVSVRLSDRKQTIDDGQDDQQKDAEAEAPADQLLLDWQQRLGPRSLQLGLKFRVLHDPLILSNSTRQWRFDTGKEEPGNQNPTQITKPNKLMK